MKYMKLSDYAKKFNVTYKTAHNRFKKGLINGAFKDNTNHILIPVEKQVENNNVVLYARVSSNSQKKDLKQQMNRLTDFAIKNGYTIIDSKSEIASGMNDNRTKLSSLLLRDDWNILIIEHKDRLTRFGFNYLKILLEKNGKQIKVINNSNEEKIDLMDDLVSIIYSFSARMYGLRKRKRREEIHTFLDSQK